MICLDFQCFLKLHDNCYSLCLTDLLIFYRILQVMAIGSLVKSWNPKFSSLLLYVLLYLYFHCFCQRCKQSRHLRIAKYFHQQFSIYSIRYSNLIFFPILLMYIRIKIFLIIEGILHSLCILSPVLINNMTITSVTMSASACPESP